MAEELQSVRIDKWLWAVRLFKSRSLAASACTAGHVKVDHASVKPAREVRVGDIIQARIGRVNRTIKVLALLERRIGAKLVPNHLEDLTPRKEFEKAREAAASEGVPARPKGTGRPTKKQRRQLKPFTG